MAEARSPGAAAPLDPEARVRLLDLARASISSHLRGLPPPHAPGSPSVLVEPRGVFVSLHLAKALRGCVGYPIPQRPLGEAVVACAVDAASHDTRFPPVRLEEESGLEIEISVLSIPVPGRPQEIEIGRHGLLVTEGRRRGLLLPQVALEHGLDRARFLDATCHKAGIHGPFDPATMSLELFTAEVFASGPPDAA